MGLLPSGLHERTSVIVKVSNESKNNSDGEVYAYLFVMPFTALI